MKLKIENELLERKLKKMTDKEQIMIDGVNVSGCKEYIWALSHVCNLVNGRTDKFECNYYPNCYFKQLARKTQECEELKKEIINKNEKIKELRFSVSDLTNRLCSLNAEKSFRIVDLEQTLDEIEKELKEDIYCESQECGCDDFEECLRCTKNKILDIINKAKDGK